jgi:integrase
MIQPDAVRRGLRRMIKRNADATSGSIFLMAFVLKSIAKHYVRLPPEALLDLADLCRRLKPQRLGMTAKNRARLRQFDDPRNVQDILNLPDKLYENARSKKLSPRRSALLAELGLAIELLLMCALRVKNLARLHLDHNIQWSRATRAGVCHLVIEAADVKNRQHLEFELEPETAALLKNFVDNYRPLLVPDSCRWLFGRRDGRAPIDETLLSRRVSSIIWQRTGLKVNAHLFRSLTSKLYLDRNPGGYEVVRRMLGHANTSTIIAAYTGLESVSAAKHFDQTILSLRDVVSAPRGRRKRTKR